MPDAYAGEVPVVYLTVSGGMSVSPETLMVQVAQNVPEPPARPRDVFILDEMPMTTVGKIDKTALRRDATRRAVQAALASLSTLEGEKTDVAVREGNGGRLMVTVSISQVHHELPALAHFISETLGRYGFAHEVLGA
jgi:fatty-acyl-CoA synthase